MEFLQRERNVLDRYMPDLDRQLSALALSEREKPGSPVIQLFREAGGAGLLIAAANGGAGLSVLEALAIQRALASRSPSLGVASTMHQFSLATIIEVAAQGGEMEAALLRSVAEERLLIASGFAEGRSGQGILSPTLQARWTDQGLLVSGSKRPCSLTWSMDLLTGSVMLPDTDSGEGELAVFLVPANSQGIERRRFWNSWLLAAAESDEVRLCDVLVPPELLFRVGSPGNLHPLQISGFLWFELLIAATYVGIASALVEQVLIAGRGNPDDRVAIALELEAAMVALEGAASTITEGGRGPDDLARVLFARYGAEQAIQRATDRALELIGGIAYSQSGDALYWLGASRGLSFHPPARRTTAPSLSEYLAGGSLRVQ